ncbi:PepSY domain-containing protein [Gracilimonas sp. Q87]|uniref:PepSY domain-containing protein n=1 Tax=Gracilimonas sp. Q87 TaxID=3384766 RepID=UPI00398401E5
MSWNSRRDLRKIHRWGGALIALPFLLVLITGLFLQVKKEVNWIQPPSQQGVSAIPSISFDDILSASRTVPEAKISTWQDIDRLDVRPDKGIVKVRAVNRWEIQIDTETAEVLQVAYRRSELFESLHDGSWFHDSAKLWIFLPSGLVVTVLWITGMYLFFVPYFAKRRNKKKT